MSACGGGEPEPNTADVTSPAKSQDKKAKVVAAPSQGKWSAPIKLSLVPAAAANLPDGKLLLWSAQDRFNFNNRQGSTYTAVFDPATGTSVERLANENNHNMFCPGTANLPDGRLLVSGGSSSGATSLYDPKTGVWKTAQPLNTPRAYHANVPLADGTVLALGGSWNGGVGNKHGELWSEAEGWRRLPGVPVDAMIGPDSGGVGRGDNHMWLIPTGNGRVLHAGPSAAMNWIDTRGDGATVSAGPRGDDAYAINGSTVMYDAGLILKTGGAPSYQNVNATARTYLIDTRGGAANVRRLEPMAYTRAFHNSVVLPNGQVMVIGGATRPVPFKDDTAVLAAELWDPATERFTVLPAMKVPRTYHSTALLLPDGRVASIGGGLCGGCAENHPDLEIYTPHYLLDANGQPIERPVIQSAADSAAYGSAMTVTTDTPVASFALVRLSSTTHTVNNDQRRLSLTFKSLGANRYALDIPSNPGLALPGLYMLFALDAQGVPSVAKTIRIAGEAVPRLTPPGDQLSTAGSATSLQLLASGSGKFRYAVQGLPAGLTINAASGAITGTPTTPGRYPVTVSTSNEAGTVSTELIWNVSASTTAAVRYVRFEALSEINGNAVSSMAEFNLLDPSGATMPRDGWKIVADSQETVSEPAPATAAIDGKPETYWHTQYNLVRPAPPHMLTIDLGAARPMGGMRYLPRQNSPSGRVAAWRLLVSDDGLSWRSVAGGTFPGDAQEQRVFPIDIGAGNRWPVIAALANPTVMAGENLTLDIKATDADGDRLTYAASNLPPGLTIGGTSGRIAGKATTSGVYTTRVTVSDGRGGVDTADVTFSILQRSISIDPIAAAPITAGATATWTAAGTAGASATYTWDFGDGSNSGASARNTASHRYASPGLYSVTLTITDATGARQTRTFTQAVYAVPGSTARATQSSTLGLQQPATGNARLWVVNADGNSVSAIDAVTLAKLAEVPVGNEPRALAVASDRRLWVTNKDSDSISIVDPANFTVARTIALPRASQPHGIAFAPDGKAVYVVLSATGQLLKLDPVSGATLATLAVGPNPRHLAVTPNGARVLVSRFITPPQPGESTAVVSTTRNGAPTGGEVLVVATANMTVERTVVLPHSGKTDSTTQGRGVPNYLGAPVIAPDGSHAWVPAKQDNIQRGTLRDRQNLDFQNTVRAISARIDLSTFKEVEGERIDHDNSSRAAAAAWHPTGAYLFVALPTSRQVAIVDPSKGVEFARMDVGRAPDALVVSSDGLRLFVSNFMDRTVQAVDLRRLVNFGESNFATLATVNAQSTERLSPTELIGKQFFYDARDTRMARDGYMSCAVCHDDGGHDGRVWDLTGFGEGLRNTISLEGRAGSTGHGRLHWSGNFDEVRDFEMQIRNLAGGTGLMTDAKLFTGGRDQPLGFSKAGQSANLDALDAYVATFRTMPRSPDRSANGALTGTAVAGRAVFAEHRCASCHGGSSFQANGALLSDIGTLKASSGQRLGGLLPGIDVPTLRDVRATGPWLHDGSAPTLADAIKAHRGVAMNATDLANLVAYVGQIGSEEATAPASLPAGAVRCANENGACVLPAGVPAAVYYGSGTQWTMRSAMTGTVGCNNATFGDALFGTGKSCHYVVAVKCADERTTCTVPTGTTSTILYGAGGSYHRRTGVTGSVACSTATFGDPAFGVGKACWRE